MTDLSTGVRELSHVECDAVSGGIVPVAWGIRIGGGAVLGAAGAVATELGGDGLGWDDWDEVAIGAGLGAGAGAVSGFARVREAAMVAGK